MKGISNKIKCGPEWESISGGKEHVLKSKGRLLEHINIKNLNSSFKKKTISPGAVAYACNPST